MAYQKIINLIDNTPNQLSNFRTKNWIEKSDQSRRVYNSNSDIRIKTTMLKSSLCVYRDAYIRIKGGITNAGAGDGMAARRADERNNGIVLKNCAPFISCKGEINNT